MLYNYKYSKQRHLDLLIERNTLHELNINITEKNFLNDDEFLQSLENTTFKESTELKAYLIQIISHLHWENRLHYYQLIEKLLNGPLAFLELRKKHELINNTAEKLQADLVLLEPNPKSAKFGDLVDDLMSLFDRYCPDPEIREINELGETELKTIIRQIYMEMKASYPSD